MNIDVSYNIQRRNRLVAINVISAHVQSVNKLLIKWTITVFILSVFHSIFKIEFFMFHRIVLGWWRTVCIVHARHSEFMNIWALLMGAWVKWMASLKDEYFCFKNEVLINFYCRVFCLLSSNWDISHFIHVIRLRCKYWKFIGKESSSASFE